MAFTILKSIHTIKTYTYCKRDNKAATITVVYSIEI